MPVRRPRMGTSRGEVLLVHPGYVGKVRPGLVPGIDPPDSEGALVTPTPHTTSPRGARFEVNPKKPFLKPGALDAPPRLPRRERI
jgi:mRNA interferase MazF